MFVFSDPDDGDGLMRVTVCVDWSVPVCSDPHHSHNNHTPDRDVRSSYVEENPQVEFYPTN